MTAYELAALVVKTREAQKAYFKTRAHEVLGESKKLERELDAAANAVLNPPKPGLFDVPAAGLTEARIRDLLGNPPVLDAEDYAMLATSASADPGEGIEWLPYYKIALGLLMQAFGAMAAAAHAAGAPAKGVATARALALLSNRAAAIGPQEPTPELVARVDAINARMFD